MVETYRQKHEKKLPSATQKLGILLGAALGGFLVLGLVLRALGTGTVLFGAALFALGLGLGWFARGRQKQPTVAVLPTRPRVEEAESPEVVHSARAYADQVLELNKPSSARVESVALPAPDQSQILVIPSSEPEIHPIAELEPAFSQPILTLPTVVETPEPESTPAAFERKKWSPKNEVVSPSSASVLLTPSTLEPTELKPVPLEPESPTAQSTEPLTFETVPLEPDKLEPASPERKKWSPKSKVNDTLSEAELNTLEPVSAFETAASMLEVQSETQTPARKKWVPKAKRDTFVLEPAELKPAVPTKTVLEIPHTQAPVRPVMQTTMEPGPPVKLDSREILEAMGIRLPSQSTSTVLPEVKKLDPSESEETEVPPSSGRKKWVPKRKR